jgi:hypothetical protein
LNTTGIADMESTYALDPPEHPPARPGKQESVDVQLVPPPPPLALNVSIPSLEMKESPPSLPFSPHNPALAVTEAPPVPALIR